MSVTIIPAPDMSGATAGWEMLSRAIQVNRQREQQKQANYQDLIIKLSAPDTTEDQQNAVLTQDPKQFQAFYGVPLAQVGKDIARFRTSATKLAAPTVNPEGPSTASTGAAGEGMALQGTQFAGNKRVLVEHPSGTPQEQQQRATLESTYASTAAEQQRAAANAAQAKLNAGEEQRKTAAFVTEGKSVLRTVDGKVPTFNQLQEYIKGNLDLTPTTEGQKKLESIREILQVDQSTPEGRIAMLDFATKQQMTAKELEKSVASIRSLNAAAALDEQMLANLQAGLDRTGKPLSPRADPKDIITVGKGFNDAFGAALGPLGFPTGATTDKPWISGSIPIGGPFSIPVSVAWFTQKTGDNVKLAPAIFGNGVADPAAVRRDLLAAVEPGERLKTVEFPTFDPKTHLPVTAKLSVDQAVPLVTQMRRSLTSTMPPVFAAMRAMSPESLVYMAANNPLIEQMAKAYAPDVAAMIADARKAEAAAPQAPAANAAPVDENLAPLTGDVMKLQQQVDELQQLLQGKAAGQ